MSLSDLYPDIRPSLNLDFANTKALDPRITFTRASTATYYDGVTFAKAEENLLLQSQDINGGAWGVSASGTASFANSTSNAGTAPDGTNTAARHTLQLNGGTSTGDICFLRQNFTVDTSLPYAFSIFVKSFDGTSTYTMQIAGISVENITVTGDWTRFDVLGTSSATQHGIRIRGGQGTTNSDTADILVWGAQLEQRDALTDYTATTTQPITNYVPALQSAAAGEARFDHDPVTGESKGLLIEEQRTNLLTYSEQFDNAAWGKSNSSITSNIVVAPDGTLTGDKLVALDTGTFPYVSQSFTASDNVQYTFSFYAKAGEYTECRLNSRNKAGSFRNVIFSLIDGSIVSAPTSGLTVTATNVGNGWFRFSGSFDSGTGGSSPTVFIYPTVDGSADFLGDDYSGVYIWGAQLEAGSFPTSYITTTSAQATRNADSASMTGTNFSSWYRQDEGTMFADSGVIFPTTNKGQITLSFNDSTNSNQMYVGKKYDSVTTVEFGVNYNGSGQAFMVSTPTSMTDFKMASAYQTNNFASTVSGGNIATDTVGIIPVVNQALLGTAAGSASRLNGHIKKLAYYPARLSDQQLQNLTKG